MAKGPVTRGVRRIIGPSHASRGARFVMIVGGLLQAGAILCAAGAIFDIRGGASSPASPVILTVAIVVFLPATYMAALGYTRLNPARAVLFMVPAAVLGVVVMALMVLSGGGFGPGLDTRLEGETETPAPLNFASQVITSDDATRVLGTPANPPTETHGFGNAVSSCALHAKTGRSYVRLQLIQGPGAPRVFEGYRRRGQSVTGIGDAAVIDKRQVCVIIADTFVQLSVVGVRLDDQRRTALVETARAVVDRLRQPVPTP